jgi:hypothetical protein
MFGKMGAEGKRPVHGNFAHKDKKSLGVLGNLENDSRRAQCLLGGHS